MSASALATPDQPAAIPVLLLRVAGQQLAVRPSEIAEILPLPRLVAVPEAPPIVTGAFSLSGQGVFVLPMSSLLGLSGPAEGTALYHHLLLLPQRDRGTRFALRVDRVMDITAAVPRPLPAGDSFNDCLAGQVEHGDNLVPLLSVARLITVYERERLQAFASRESTRAAIFQAKEAG